VIRVVLAVVLASALLGATLPVAERAERDRNAAVATAELQRLADSAGRLSADNDPVAAGAAPASTTVVVALPRPRLVDGGRVVVADDRLVWQPATGANRTVRTPVPLRVATPISVADRARLRLSLVRGNGSAVVIVELTGG
jgi:hypothetical protein